MQAVFNLVFGLVIHKSPSIERMFDVFNLILQEDALALFNKLGLYISSSSTFLLWQMHPHYYQISWAL